MRTPPPALTSVLCVVLLLAAVGVPLLGQVAGGEKYLGWTVDRATLTPDGPLSQAAISDLERLILFQPGSPFDPIAVKQSVERLFSTGLFFDIQVVARPLAQGHLALEFQATRTVMVTTIDFSGDEKLDPDLLLREVMLREREPFDREALQTTMARLSTFYEKNGYFRRRIRAKLSRNADASQVEVTFQIEAGSQARIREVVFDAEPPANVAVIGREIQTRRGQRFSGLQLDADLENLIRQFALIGYLNAEVYVKDKTYHSQDNTVSVSLRINPRDHIGVHIQGARLADAERQELLPIYSERSSDPVFVQESARNLADHLQREGHVFAAVTPAIRGEPGKVVILAAKPGDKHSVGEVRLENVGPQDEREIRSLLQIRSGSLFSRGLYTADLMRQDAEKVRNFFYDRGHVTAQILPRLERSDGSVRAVFRVDAGPLYRIRSVRIEGNRSLDEASLLASLQSRPGEVYAPSKVALDRSFLLTSYEDQGFANIDFHSDVRYSTPDDVEITYYVTEGDRFTIEDILVTGNRHTRGRIIQRELTVAPGQPVSLEKMLASESNLYNLGIFNRVAIESQPAFNDPLKKVLLVQVEESKRYTVTYGVGYEENEPRGTLGISDNNVLGRAQTVAASLRAGSRQQLGQLSLTLPRPFEWRLPTILSLLVQHEEKRQGDLQEDLGKPFDTSRRTVLLQSERRLNQQTSLFLRYNFEQVNVKHIDDIELLFRENRPVRLSKISASLLNDRRDDPIDASRGTFSSIDLQLTPRLLGSQAQYGRLFLTQQYFRPFKDNVLALSGRFGLLQPFGKNSADERLSPELRNPVPISERFFAGGSTSLRGFRLDQAGPLIEKTVVVNGNPEKRLVPVGGNILMIWNSELRVPLYRFIRGAMFYDFGNVFPGIGNVSLGDFSHAVGLGLRLRTPVGPIRADFGYNLNPPPNFKRGLIFFTIGQTF